MKAIGEVYRVEGDWFEYTIALYGDNGEVVDEWDSQTETYNGIQKLDEQTAQDAINQIVQDVQEGKASDWFTV